MSAPSAPLESRVWRVGVPFKFRLSFAAKLLLLVLLPLAVVVGVTVPLVVNGMTRLENDSSLARLRDEVAIISQQFAKAESALALRADALANDPVLAGAINGRNATRIQRTVQEALIRSDLDYLRVSEISGGVLGREYSSPGLTIADEAQQVGPLTSSRVRTTRFLPTDQGWMLTAVQPIKDRGTLVGTLIAGRLFDESHGSDVYALEDEPAPRESAAVVINESAIARLGYASADDALGKTMRTGRDGRTEITIIGVVSDMQFLTIRQSVAPMMFLVDESQRYVMSVYFSTRDYDTFSNDIDAIWNQLVPGAPITKILFEDSLDARYASEATRAKVLGVFAFLAIIVSSLGLYGLASYSTARRRKEVGIRKVLGARVGDIVTLMVWQFSIPVLVANIVAWPVAWYFMQNWLEGFAYRIDLNPALFLGAGLITLIIAWGTVGAHAIQAARTNPINALRYE